MVGLAVQYLLDYPTKREEGPLPNRVIVDMLNWEVVFSLVTLFQVRPESYREAIPSKTRPESLFASPCVCVCVLGFPGPFLLCLHPPFPWLGLAHPDSFSFVFLYFSILIDWNLVAGFPFLLFVVPFCLNTPMRPSQITKWVVEPNPDCVLCGPRASK